MHGHVGYATGVFKVLGEPDKGAAFMVSNCGVRDLREAGADPLPCVNALVTAAARKSCGMVSNMGQ